MSKGGCTSLMKLGQYEVQGDPLKIFFKVVLKIVYILYTIRQSPNAYLPCDSDLKYECIKNYVGLRQLENKFIVGYFQKTEVRVCLCVSFKFHYYFEVL